MIKESQATEWSQVHLVPKPTPEGRLQKWRFIVRLNSATGGLEGWPIHKIQQIINRIGTLKPEVFDIIDFTAGYHQKPLHPDCREYTAFITQYGLFEWNRVAMGLKGSCPFFQRSMANKVLAGYVIRICEIYINDVLLFGIKHPFIVLFLPLISTPFSLLFYLLVFKLLYLMLFLLILSLSVLLLPCLSEFLTLTLLLLTTDNENLGNTRKVVGRLSGGNYI